ncbi:MAG: hypothetical protein HYZ31_02665, partial [Gammaproteobacteria bacterium]|nr:hypothetical protein [Gammaproteobacteria bacterium]
MFNRLQQKACRLILFLTLLGSATASQAGLFCSEFDEIDPPSPGNPGTYVIDGTRVSGNIYNLLAGGTTSWPTQITIDANCTFQNFVSPNDLDVTLNFQTPGQGAKPVYLIVFDNVSYSGNMACANIDHRIWLVNGSRTDFSSRCQDLFIPVEAISKQNPIGKTAVGIGEIFNYTLIIPVLYDPATGTVIDGSGTNVDLHTIRVTDDLNATGADLTVVGTPVVTWNSSPLNHTYTNNAGVLTFVIDPGFVLPAGDQILITIPVVVDNTNTVGTQFVNTASWNFGRVISLDPDGDGIFEDVFFDPLPGENGVTQPLTIGAPGLTMSKTSLDTTLAPGSVGNFTLDVQNTGTSTAFEPTIVDRLPESVTASMCVTDPASLPLSAGIYQADGTTLVQSL